MVVLFAGGGLGVDLAVGPLVIMIGLATVGETRLALNPTRARQQVADRFVYIAAGYALFLGGAPPWLS